MKYFNLSPEEITLMKMTSRKKFLPYLLGFVLLLTVILITYYQLVRHQSHNFSPGSLVLTVSSFVIGSMLVHFLYTTGVIQTVLKRNQKIVYSGILTEKKVKENGSIHKYVFYMDGMKFSVNESDYTSYALGEKIEFHVSLNGKHLIKVARPVA